MPEKTVKRRLQDCDAALASDEGPIFSTVAKLVAALKRSIPQGSENVEPKKEALHAARELLRAGPSTKKSDDRTSSSRHSGTSLAGH
jgi:hypothetical protein